MIAVGERIDEEIRQEITENRKPDNAANTIVIRLTDSMELLRPFSN